MPYSVTVSVTGDDHLGVRSLSPRKGERELRQFTPYPQHDQQSIRGKDHPGDTTKAGPISPPVLALFAGELEADLPKKPEAHFEFPQFVRRQSARMETKTAANLGHQPAPRRDVIVKNMSVRDPNAVFRERHLVQGRNIGIMISRDKLNLRRLGREKGSNLREEFRGAGMNLSVERIPVEDEAIHSTQ